MRNLIQLDQTLDVIEKNIQLEVTECEFWGDLELSYDETDILSDLIRTQLKYEGVSIVNMCEKYPHVMTTYMVFFVRYKYDANFWSTLSEHFGVEIPQYLHNELGSCARKMFKKYNMDFSETKDEIRKNIAPIIYEACLPPESSYNDLFYIMSYDSCGVFDPQAIIDELIEMRSYSIRKPMLRFLSRFKDDRAIDFVLEVRDAMIAVHEKSSASSRYTTNYVKWKESESSKSEVNNRKKKEFQTKPHLFFDNGKKGLCIILPRTIMRSEWVVEATWTISTGDGFVKNVYCNIMGDEGRRYTDTIMVPVPPAEKYRITLSDSEEIDNKTESEWEIEGIRNDNIVYFNSNGRQVSANYLLHPFGIMVIPETISIEKCLDLEIQTQFYPTNNEKYHIVSVTPTSYKANLIYNLGESKKTINSRPQINMILNGKSLFSLDKINPNINIFTEIPELKITVDGEIGTSNLELRIAGVAYPINIDRNGNNIFNLKKLAKMDVNRFGTYSIRLYQFGRFLKQVEFSYVPKIKTNYKPNISWNYIHGQQKRKEFKFQKLDDWEMEFKGCVVSDDGLNYIVEVPVKFSEISTVLKSTSDDFVFSCEFILPLKPYGIELVDFDGNLIANATDRPYKADLDTLVENDIWISAHMIGEFRLHSYKLLLKTANGIEQEKRIGLTPNGVGNANLAVFYDTLRNCPLPAEIVLMCDEDEEKTISIAKVNEKLSLEVKPKYQRKNNYIVLDIADDGKDIDVTRFGFDHSEIHIPYEKSRLAKSKKVRAYPYPDTIKEGIYIVNGSKEQEIFDFSDDGIQELTPGNNIVFVSCLAKGDKIQTAKHIIDLLVGDCIHTAFDKDFSTSQSYNIFSNVDYINNIGCEQLNDVDIEKVVALGYFANSKIVNDAKVQLRQCMREISARFLNRGDRSRIIKLLIELNAPQEVFDICLKEYSLLLCVADKKEARNLAAKVDSYSVELAMVLMMSTDGSVRNCLAKAKFKELIGKEAIKKLLNVPEVENPEEIIEEQIKFLKEIKDNKVRIDLNDEIAGNEEAIQSMIRYDKKGNPVFDLSNKPDYGVYFARIKYVDQYVNWYKHSHNRNQELDPVKKQIMKDVVKENMNAIENGIYKLCNDEDLKEMTKQYVKALKARFSANVHEISMNTVSYPRFFYLLGIAAYLAKLPIERQDIDDIRLIGIRFMSHASIVVPGLAQRDILMAATYIYLKRKEEKQCQ